LPVAAREPNSSARSEAVRSNTPLLCRPVANIFAARIGPTVCELDGPIPTLNRSNTLMATRQRYRRSVPPGRVPLAYPFAMPEFTHLDPLGRARMVDVTPKEPTHRRAVARCKVFMLPATTEAIANREVKKGDVLAVARVAGIQAAKRTSDLIPLCHPLLVGGVYINFTIGDDNIEVEANVDTVDRTGVEMEALTACSVAALTIYDMCKSADRAMVIGELCLWEKTGGRSGTFRRPAAG
jgi:cyclic pyranopterin phosphate synthase